MFTPTPIWNSYRENSEFLGLVAQKSLFPLLLIFTIFF